jgi:DNA-binding response OmpR family regulator
MPARAHTIVIVESHGPTSDLYRRALEDDYEVVACADADEALGVLQERPISAVVLEPAASHGRGWALVTALRESAATRAVPVVVCSSLDERLHGQEVGVTAYLVKPVLPTTLLATLRDVIPRG